MEDEEEDVNSQWTMLSKREDTGKLTDEALGRAVWRTRAVDLSQGRRRNE